METRLASQLFDSRVVTLEADPKALGPQAVVFDEERAAVARAVEKRRFEYYATRQLAHEAFRSLGVPVVPVLNRQDRSPIWPSGVIGTLTHTAGWCAVAVALPQPACVSLGLDAERAYDMSTEVARRVLTDLEFQRLSSLSPSEFQSRATLCFSAKEAVYKCLFPFVQRYIGFEEVEIELDFAASSGPFAVRLLNPELGRAAGPPGYALSGRFISEGNLWVTGVTMGAADAEAADGHPGN
jgi:4'-phosphopantetheinyl transferase EntD